MTRTPKLVIMLFFAVIAGTVSLLIINSDKLAVFNTQGTIGNQQRDLMYFTMALSLAVVIPVFLMTFIIGWKYRASNNRAEYKPDWDKSIVAETIWWGVPIILISILAVITWNTSHSLDPFKPISANDKTLTVQVVALEWKWLFIYPDQGVAAVNLSQIPTNIPIKYEITSDAPMNSFWIPQLGGQIYAMSGMVTNLNLMADNPGKYRGVSANISGEGFAGMSFIVKASDKDSFNKWLENTKKNPNILDQSEYESLKKPTKNNPIKLYGSIDKSLYDNIVMKYMVSGHSKTMKESY